jgi:hypothetical protein
MKSKKNLLKKQKKLVEKLKSVEPFVGGCVTIINRVCGTKTCSCMSGGEKHRAMYLNSKLKGKTKSLYIPVALHDDVKKWNENYKKLKSLIKEISDNQEEIIKLR